MRMSDKEKAHPEGGASASGRSAMRARLGTPVCPKPHSSAHAMQLRDSRRERGSTFSRGQGPGRSTLFLWASSTPAPAPSLRRSVCVRAADGDRNAELSNAYKYLGVISDVLTTSLAERDSELQGSERSVSLRLTFKGDFLELSGPAFQVAQHSLPPLWPPRLTQ